MFLNVNCLGESGPGCSAHAEGCDGSTGIQPFRKKFDNILQGNERRLISWYIGFQIDLEIWSNFQQN